MILTPQNYQTIEYPRFYSPPPGSSDESRYISTVFIKESSQEPISQQGINSENTICQTYLEPLTNSGLEYHRPKPKRTYKMKVHVLSKCKGKPVNYDE